MENKNDYFPSRVVAEKLGIHKSTVSELAKKHKLDVVVNGG